MQKPPGGIPPGIRLPSWIQTSRLHPGGRPPEPPGCRLSPIMWPVMHAEKLTPPTLNKLTHRCKILPCSKLQLRAVIIGFASHSAVGAPPPPSRKSWTRHYPPRLCLRKCWIRHCILTLTVFIKAACPDYRSGIALLCLNPLKWVSK